MKNRIVIAIFCLLPVLLLSNYATTAAPTTDDLDVEVYIYEYGNPPPEIAALRDGRASTYTDLAVHGTMWQPQFRGHFSWAVKGWGTETRAVSGYENSYQWVHLSVPYATYIIGVAQKINYVEFCAKADHPNRTSPVRLDLWSHDTRLVSVPLSWPNSTAIHCVGVHFSPTIWKEDLGLSVLNKYDNLTDMVTLYKGWVYLDQ